MSVPVMKIGVVLSTMAMVANWMSQTLPSLVGLNGTLVAPDGTHEKRVSGVFPGEEEEGWSVFTSSSVPDGGCVCTVVAPGNNLCSRDAHSHQTHLLALQMQTISLLIQDVFLGSSRDLQLLQDSEPLLRGVEGRVHTHTLLTPQALQELKGQMSQLLPLLLVTSQYMSRLQTLSLLRDQLLNLSVILSANQEEAGGWSYEELQESAVVLETRLLACMNKLGCGHLTDISAPVTVRVSGSRFGAWMTDGMMLSSDTRVWSMDGYVNGKRVLEFRNMEDFLHGRSLTQHLLPYPWSGTGHVVYNGSLYYNKHHSNILVQYDLRSRQVLQQRTLEGAGSDTFPYSWGGASDIDLMVDEVGLWAVHASLASAGNIQVSRLDPLTLSPLRSWDTGFPKRSAGESFLICGTLYITDSHLSGAKIRFSFSTTSGEYRYTDIPFHNRYAHISMLDYNPRERLLFSWNNGHQVLYNITLVQLV
ncbi:noelin-2-like [Osmerus mordax]|uniref:noelin-2-like n=1 Tax=Osmerus mordax TaxID=8014 RepID=UPI00350F8743